jgi:hypothetical protein
MSDWIKIGVEFIKALPVSGRAVLIPTLPVKLWIPWQRKLLAPTASRSRRRAR